MTWKERFREDKQAKLTVSVTAETYTLFKELCAEQGTNSTAMIRAMVKHILSEYADEIREVA